MESKKDRVLVGIVLAMCVVGGGYWYGDVQGVFDDFDRPIEAAGMTVEQRLEIDAELIREVSGADSVDINYKNATIAITLDIPSSQQYAESEGERAADSINELIDGRRGELTLEKDSYSVFVYGNDGGSIYMEI